MAKAKQFSRRIKHVKVTYSEQPGCVELNLLPEEATFLRTILARIGGSPTDSPRAIADTIAEALDAAGVQSSDTYVYDYNTSLNSIYFKDSK